MLAALCCVLVFLVVAQAGQNSQAKMHHHALMRGEKVGSWHSEDLARLPQEDERAQKSDSQNAPFLLSEQHRRPPKKQQKQKSQALMRHHVVTQHGGVAEIHMANPNNPGDDDALTNTIAITMPKDDDTTMMGSPDDGSGGTSGSSPDDGGGGTSGSSSGGSSADVKLLLLPSGIQDDKWSSEKGHNATKKPGVTKKDDTVDDDGDGIDDAYYKFDGTKGYLAVNEMSFHGTPITHLVAEIRARTSFKGVSWSDNWSLLDFDRSEWFNVFIRANDGKAMACSTGKKANGAYHTNDALYGGDDLRDGKWHTIKYTFSTESGHKLYVDGNETPVSTNDAFSDLEKSGTAGIGIGKISQRRHGVIGDGSEASGENGNRNRIHFDGDIKWVKLCTGTSASSVGDCEAALAPAPAPTPAPAVCTCQDGDAASGDDCPADGDVKCVSCHPGYHLDNHACNEKQCQCDHGAEATGVDCPNEGDSKCTECDSGFELNGVQCDAIQQSQDQPAISHSDTKHRPSISHSDTTNEGKPKDETKVKAPKTAKEVKEEKKGGGSMILIVAGVLVVLLVGGGGAAVFMQMKKGDKAEPTEEKEQQEPDYATDEQWNDPDDWGAGNADEGAEWEEDK